MGSYLHGMFSQDPWRAAFLATFGVAPSGVGYSVGVERALDDLAAHVEVHLDVDAIICGGPGDVSFLSCLTSVPHFCRCPAV